MPFRTCNFIKPDGIPCGSPSLRGKKLCHFHHRDHQRQVRMGSALRRSDVLGPRLPPMRSLADVQFALTEVCNALLDIRVPIGRASRILYDLQEATASVLHSRSS